MKRQLDKSGRLVIPVEMRKELNINPGDELNMTVGGNGIFISKTGCMFCGSPHAAIYYQGVQVPLCEFCLDSINEKCRQISGERGLK